MTKRSAVAARKIAAPTNHARHPVMTVVFPFLVTTIMSLVTSSPGDEEDAQPGNARPEEFEYRPPAPGSGPLRKISAELAAAGFVNKSGKPYHAQSIQRIVEGHGPSARLKPSPFVGMAAAALTLSNPP